MVQLLGPLAGHLVHGLDVGLDGDGALDVGVLGDGAPGLDGDGAGASGAGLVGTAAELELDAVAEAHGIVAALGDLELVVGVGVLTAMLAGALAGALAAAGHLVGGGAVEGALVVVAELAAGVLAHLPEGVDAELAGGHLALDGDNAEVHGVDAGEGGADDVLDLDAVGTGAIEGHGHVHLAGVLSDPLQVNTVDGVLLDTVVVQLEGTLGVEALDQVLQGDPVGGVDKTVTAGDAVDGAAVGLAIPVRLQLLLGVPHPPHGLGVPAIDVAVVLVLGLLGVPLGRPKVSANHTLPPLPPPPTGADPVLIAPLAALDGVAAVVILEEALVLVAGPHPVAGQGHGLLTPVAVLVEHAAVGVLAELVAVVVPVRQLVPGVGGHGHVGLVVGQEGLDVVHLVDTVVLLLLDGEVSGVLEGTAGDGGDVVVARARGDVGDAVLEPVAVLR